VTYPLLWHSKNAGAARTGRAADKPRAGGAVQPRFPDNPTFFALRTTSAALLALAAAYGFGLHRPWWAAMTVWLVAQPTRGLLIERSVFRLAGTACGAIVGVAIVQGAADRTVLAILALLLWLALCAGLGSIFRHFRNYGLVLAGYTAALVVLLNLGNATHDPGVALNRVLCTVIGIVCSTIGSLPSLPAGGEELTKRLNAMLQRCLDRVEAYLRDSHALGSADQLIGDIGALDRTLDEDAAGSLSGRRDAIRMRRILGLLLELTALTPGEPTTNPAMAPPPNGSPERRTLALTSLARAKDEASLANTLEDLLEGLRGPVLLLKPTSDFDVSSIVRAALRPVVAVSIALAIWWSSSWQYGNMMVLTAALFATLFSSHDQGNQALIQVLVGSLIGGIAGSMAHLFLLPYTAELLPTLLCIAPFVLLGAWLMCTPSAAAMAVNFNMTFLLTAQPTSPAAGAEVVLNQTAAILAGVMIVIATYWLVLPANAQVRVRLLARRVAHLTLRIAWSSSLTAAANIQRSLGATQVRLLDFVEPTSGLFVAAQNCLAEGRRALVRWKQPQTLDELLRASTALSSSIEPTQREAHTRPNVQSDRSTDPRCR
jgi:uncharacterized membrane protein YccC